MTFYSYCSEQRHHECRLGDLVELLRVVKATAKEFLVTKLILTKVRLQQARQSWPTFLIEIIYFKGINELF